MTSADVLILAAQYAVFYAVFELGRWLGRREGRHDAAVDFRLFELGVEIEPWWRRR